VYFLRLIEISIGFESLKCVREVNNILLIGSFYRVLETSVSVNRSKCVEEVEKDFPIGHSFRVLDIRSLSWGSKLERNAKKYIYILTFDHPSHPSLAFKICLGEIEYQDNVLRNAKVENRTGTSRNILFIFLFIF